MDATERQTMILLAEYEQCHKHVERMETLTWQTASVFFPLSIAGLAFLAQGASAISLGQLAIVYIVGISSIVILLGWLRISQRWWLYGQIGFHRMLEIEEQLGLWQLRYSHFLRWRRPYRSYSSSSDENLSEEEARYANLKREYPKFPYGSTRSIVRLIVYVLVAGWLLLIVRTFLSAVINS